LTRCIITFYIFQTVVLKDEVVDNSDRIVTIVSIILYRQFFFQLVDSCFLPRSKCIEVEHNFSRVQIPKIGAPLCGDGINKPAEENYSNYHQFTIISFLGIRPWEL